jgi:hypothetical protein
MRWFVTGFTVVLWTSISVADAAEKHHWNFEDVEVGALPKGWMAAKTGDGDGSVWKIVVDKSAPAGAQVLAQVAAGPRPLFNLCVAQAPLLRDVELSVSFQAVQGKIDQGGGVVWRYADANNYYIARFNPLENNLRLYKVVDGKRTQLATVEELQAPAGKWHTLDIRMQGDKIACSLNGKRLIEATDTTFTKSGKIGLWTKADAETRFDQLVAHPIE